MQIRVLFFGLTADLVGKRALDIDLSAKRSAGNILDQLAAEYPSLALHQLHFSVNQQYANGEELLKEGDEIAVFTAVSGG